jgi:hypothetical protein
VLRSCFGVWVTWSSISKQVFFQIANVLIYGYYHYVFEPNRFHWREIMSDSTPVTFEKGKLYALNIADLLPDPDLRVVLYKIG